MNAAQLISLAGARGVDLQYVAATSIETEGIARRRSRNELEIELGIAVQETAKGRESRSARRPAWTLAELAQAAGGRVSGVQWAAVRYSISGDASVHDDLQSSLFGHALHLSRRDCWPVKVNGPDGQAKFYLEELAALVLDEDAHRRYFAAAPLLYAAYMDVRPLTWDKHLEGPFASLKAKYSSWIALAMAGIQRGIRGDQAA